MWILGLKGLTSPTGDGTAILCGHPSHAVVVLVVFMMIFCGTSLELLSWATFRLVSNCRSLNYLQRFHPFLFFVRFSIVVIFIYCFLK